MSITKSKHYRIIQAHERPLELMEPMNSCTAKKKNCPCNPLNRVNPRMYLAASPFALPLSQATLALLEDAEGQTNS